MPPGMLCSSCVDAGRACLVRPCSLSSPRVALALFSIVDIVLCPFREWPRSHTRVPPWQPWKVRLAYGPSLGRFSVLLGDAKVRTFARAAKGISDTPLPPVPAKGRAFTAAQGRGFGPSREVFPHHPGGACEKSCPWRESLRFRWKTSATRPGLGAGGRSLGAKKKDWRSRANPKPARTGADRCQKSTASMGLPPSPEDSLSTISSIRAWNLPLSRLDFHGSCSNVFFAVFTELVFTGG